MKRGRRNKMSGTFFPHRPVASLKMFPCVVSDQIESKEGKHSLLQTTCNRFFLRPNKSTLCFRSCDTFLVLCFIPDISCVGPPNPPPPLHPALTRMHIQSFHFPCVRSPGQAMACSSATCSGRKTGRRVQGCLAQNARRVRGNPEVVAAVYLLKTRK